MVRVHPHAPQVSHFRVGSAINKQSHILAGGSDSPPLLCKFRMLAANTNNYLLSNQVRILYFLCALLVELVDTFALEANA